MPGRFEHTLEAKPQHIYKELGGPWLKEKFNTFHKLLSLHNVHQDQGFKVFDNPQV